MLHHASVAQLPDSGQQLMCWPPAARRPCGTSCARASCSQAPACAWSLLPTHVGSWLAAAAVARCGAVPCACCQVGREHCEHAMLAVQRSVSANPGGHHAWLRVRRPKLPLPSVRPRAAVPANAGQRAAVAGVGGGLSVIHGPPGTGKSTTIFHIVEGRVQPKAQVRGAGSWGAGRAAATAHMR